MRKLAYLPLIALLFVVAPAFAQVPTATPTAAFPVLMIAMPQMPIQVGATAQLTPMLVTAPGVSGHPVTASSWTSSDPAVATVSNTGLVTAVAAGRTWITATYNGTQGTTSVMVQPAGNP